MPERDRLASSLLQVAPMHSTIGLAALRDLVALYRKETEIEEDSCDKDKIKMLYYFNLKY